MSKPFKVSHSKLKTWLRCRRAYWYKYVEKLRRKRVSRPLMFGRIAHDMLEAQTNGLDPMKVLQKLEKEQGKLFKSEVEEYGDILDDARVILSEYFDFYAKSGLKFIPLSKKDDSKLTEYKFELEIAPSLVLTGRIDGVAKTPNKLKWLVEHKSFSRIPNEDHRWRSVQSVIYVRILEMLDLIEVDGTLWDYIWSKAPSGVQFKEDGGVSKRRIVTLPMKLKESLAEAGKHPDKFTGLMKAAQDSRKQYFQRIFNPTKPQVVESLFKDFVSTAKEVQELHGKRSERNIDRHCDWCEFEGLCRAELMGLDANFIRKKEYVVHENSDEEVEPDFEG